MSTKHLEDVSIALFSSASMAASANSAAVRVAESGRFSGVLSWANTSTPVGIFRLQVSMDNSNWYDRTDGDDEFTAVVDGSTTTSATFNFVDLGWRWARIRYVRTSGGAAGTLNGTGSVKE